jgi:ribosomal protein S18 acetylase RimI-like enzyme
MIDGSTVSHEPARPPQEGELTPASIEDAPDIQAIMQQAADLKISQGDDIWGTEPVSEEEVARMLDQGNVFVYKIEGQNAASLVIAESDTRIWGEVGEDGTAMYVHRLCTADAFRGQNLGGAVLERAAELARQSGKQSLRLDCSYENRGLCDYYEGLGFTEVRREDRPPSTDQRNIEADGYKVAMYERAL